MSAHMDGNTQDIIDYFVSDCWYNIYLGYNDYIVYCVKTENESWYYEQYYIIQFCLELFFLFHEVLR